MKTLLELVALSADYLKQKEISHPRRQAEELIADALKIKRVQLYMEFDRPLNDEELERCRKYLQRRAKGEPLPYIHGQADFYHCQFNLNRNVLIPRQETEILTDKIARCLEQQNLEGKVLWDICCGSGCIGISLAKKFPQLKVELADLSPEALAVARENAALNGVDIPIHEGDLLNPFKGKRADYIVCNPPYISEEEYKFLEKEVRDYEPRMALVSGATGIEYYQRLARELPSYLNPGAKGWMEIGTGQGKAVSALFDHPVWKNLKVEKDWAGHERFFFLEIE